MTDILTVDDDPALQRTLRINLQARGYGVVIARDGRTALDVVTENPPDLVLLDLGLPDLDGITVLRRLRDISTVPVIVLSARQTSDDIVEALDLGANDYVTKPFGMEELLARLRAVLRDRTPTPGAAVVESGPLRIDLGNHEVTVSGRSVHLTPTEWKIVGVLAADPGRLIRHADLLREVWGPTYGRETNYLRVYLAGIRRKLEADPGHPRHFRTEPGAGYRFVV